MTLAPMSSIARATLGLALLAAVPTLGACGDNLTPLAAVDGAPPPSLRDARYCEFLIVYLAGADATVDVYNTIGLGDCPAETWAAADADLLQAQLGAFRVIKNGPRHWLIDGFRDSMFVDDTPVTLAGLPMRKAGQLHLPLATLLAAGPYATLSVDRRTTYYFAAGREIYELVDPTARAFVMQSFSLQQEPLTVEALAGLGARLTLPAGWSYRARTLAAQLDVTAIDGVATVTQDGLGDTYQLHP